MSNSWWSKILKLTVQPCTKPHDPITGHPKSQGGPWLQRGISLDNILRASRTSICDIQRSASNMSYDAINNNSKINQKTENQRRSVSLSRPSINSMSHVWFSTRQSSLNNTKTRFTISQHDYSSDENKKHFHTYNPLETIIIDASSKPISTISRAQKTRQLINNRKRYIHAQPILKYRIDRPDHDEGKIPPLNQSENYREYYYHKHEQEDPLKKDGSTPKTKVKKIHTSSPILSNLPHTNLPTRALHKSSSCLLNEKQLDSVHQKLKVHTNPPLLIDISRNTASGNRKFQIKPIQHFCECKATQTLLYSSTMQMRDRPIVGESKFMNKINQHLQKRVLEPPKNRPENLVLTDTDSKDERSPAKVSKDYHSAAMEVNKIINNGRISRLDNPPADSNSENGCTQFDSYSKNGSHAADCYKLNKSDCEEMKLDSRLINSHESLKNTSVTLESALPETENSRQFKLLNTETEMMKNHKDSDILSYLENVPSVQNVLEEMPNQETRKQMIDSESDDTVYVLKEDKHTQTLCEGSPFGKYEKNKLEGSSVFCNKSNVRDTSTKNENYWSRQEYHTLRPLSPFYVPPKEENGFVNFDVRRKSSGNSSADKWAKKKKIIFSNDDLNNGQSVPRKQKYFPLYF